ncbi:MAG: peroxidase family protein, partial [Bacteroidota bacterium]
RRSARDISNIVVDQPGIIFSAQNLSAIVYNWGQFLDHDIDLTPEYEEEYEPIQIPTDETLFTMEIPFFRSEFYNLPNDGLPREQLNVITAWIDGSNVYGSEDERADWLRTHTDGKLKTSAGNLLPFNTLDGEYASAVDTTAPSTAGADANGKMWVAGDVRVGEQVGLTTLHTLFVREHNRICDELIAAGLTDDDAIYQEARKKVVALIQKITYQEFLPALGVSLPAYTGYDSSVNPNISNLFSAAAYRLGHTMVVDSVRMLDNDCNPVGDTLVSLVEAFFNPEIIRNYDIDYFLKGLTVEVQYEVDPYIVPELRDFLFSDPNTSPVVGGLDLAAANIQRGRDHGLPDYNSIREYFLGAKATSFADITSDSMVNARLVQASNGDLDEIDPWVGFVSEDLVSGTSLGPTLHAIMEDQFGRLRDGDSFYYESYLTGDDLTEVNATTLSDIVMRNTGLSGLEANIMYADIDCDGTTSTGISTPEFALQIKVFPNPTTGLLHVKWEDPSLSIANFSVLNVRGQEVVRDRAFAGQIDLSDLPTGIYSILLNTNQGLAIKRIVLTD